MAKCLSPSTLGVGAGGREGCQPRRLESESPVWAALAPPKASLPGGQTAVFPPHRVLTWLSLHVAVSASLLMRTQPYRMDSGRPGDPLFP